MLQRDATAKTFLPKPIMGCVYAVEFEDGAVKIGSSSNCAQRFYSLQNGYRKRPSSIVNVFISEITDDCRTAEHNATAGLKPCEKKEIFPITFDDAVERIESIIPSVERIDIRGRQNVVKEFPCLERPLEGMERVFRGLLGTASVQ